MPYLFLDTETAKDVDVLRQAFYKLQGLYIAEGVRV